MSGRKWILTAFLLIAVITTGLYLPTLQNDFVNWDDPYYVYENQHIQSLDLQFFHWIFTTFHAANWHPLTLLSHAIDYAVWGLNPGGHHLTSIIFHGLNTFLVMIIVLRLVGCTDDRQRRPLPPEREMQFADPRLVIPVTTGLLFGIHPLHVESVSWISERKDVLSGFFFLFAIYLYLRYTASERGKGKKKYILSLLFFVFALMSKPMAVTLPAVLLILDMYPLERLQWRHLFTTQRRIFMEKLPFLFFSLLSLIVTVQAQQSVSAIKPLRTFYLGDRFLNAFRALCFYMYKILWPKDLAPLYPYPAEISLFQPEYIISTAAVFLITLVCVYVWRKQKIWLALWAYYVITLLPVLGIVQVGDQAAADRYTYLPSLGPFILIGTGIARFLGAAGNEKGRFLFQKAVVVLLVGAIGTVLLFNSAIRQQKIWSNSVTLWEREIALYPDRAYQAYYNLGNAYLSLGRTDDAIRQYQTALKMNPYYLHAYYSLGKAYQGKGLLDKAITYYQYAIKLKDDFPDARVNLGYAYQLKGLLSEAMREYKIALELNPDSPEAHNNIGLAYQSGGFYEVAIRHFRIAIELRPDFANAHKNLGFAYFVQRNYDRAVYHLERALTLNPDDAQAHLNLSLVFKSQGLQKKADQHLRTARNLNPSLFQRGATHHSSPGDAE